MLFYLKKKILKDANESSESLKFRAMMIQSKTEVWVKNQSVLQIGSTDSYFYNPSTILSNPMSRDALLWEVFLLAVMHQQVNSLESREVMFKFTRKECYII